ncbi:hypothetical protein FOCG_06736 [Fusarium oxysporum f. sp. radicis-lycopersici 26381]|uniref:Uncharacterized protein n=1 Tax=Fusarium oxysporum Fo47 TaxID=660027 RepID=W9L4B2_FUSOX|nr:hypothetical protein FOZG_03794 [Fusarium oxysporum Fo47]EXL53431.1 hypothetical protein FOCG_06736 [Fusarium oxysporum f. sp. radicis-lycopersici 26381]
MFAHLHMQIDCLLTLTHSLLQNPRDGKKQLHLDICCIVKALSSSSSLLPPSSFTPKTVGNELPYCGVPPTSSPSSDLRRNAHTDTQFGPDYSSPLPRPSCSLLASAGPLQLRPSHFPTFFSSVYLSYAITSHLKLLLKKITVPDSNPSLSITRHRTSSRFRQAIDFISNLATSPLALIFCKQS